MRLSRAVALLLLTTACDGGTMNAPDAGADARAADATAADASPRDLPARLIDTGLYAEESRETVSPDVWEYTVNYELWADQAQKRRFLWLPPDTKIDASDADFWRFPVGTKVWKEFSLGGERLETRYLVKTGPFARDWEMAAYVWDAAETEARLEPDGVEDVGGTQHDVPGTEDCRRCHRHQPDILIGVGGIQLSHDEPGLNLDALIEADLITDHVDDLGFELPGTAEDKAALGYLHGNCGVCHHDTSDVQESIEMRLRLRADSLGSVEETTIYTTTVGEPLALPYEGATSLIAPGEPEESAIYLRMSSRGEGQMPPLATEQVDEDAAQTVQAWISGL